MNETENMRDGIYGAAQPNEMRHQGQPANRERTLNDEYDEHKKQEKAKVMELPPNNEVIEAEIVFLREQIKTLRRTANACERQIDHMETRIDDLRRVAQPPPGVE